MFSKHGYQALGRDFGKGRSHADKQKALTDLRMALKEGHVKPEDFSVRSLAEHLVEDGREWVATMDPRHGPQDWQEAAGAVSVASFSNITGQIVYSKLLEAYQSSAMVFAPLVQTIPTSLDGEKIAGIGGLGDQAAIVNEGQAYPLAGVTEDYIETPSTTKRGFIVPVTKETIFFDRTNLIVQRAGEVGQFLGLNKEKRIIDCIVDENGGAVSTPAGHRLKWKGTYYATYQSSTPWVNIKASNTLIDWTNIDAALLVASQIVDPTTGEPIVNVGTDMIVCPQLAATARRILTASMVQVNSGGYATSGNLNSAQSPNPIMNIPGYSPAAYQIHTSPLLAARMTTDTSWYIGDIKKAFAYMENWPITVVQAPPNSELEFSNDIVLRFKASERGTAATLDPRMMVKSTVA